MRLFFNYLLALIVCACAPNARAAVNPSDHIRLTDLGAGVIPTAINNVGQVAGQGADGIAFRWQANTFTSLGTLGGTQSYANDLNDSGTVIGWANDAAGKKKSFRWGKVPGAMENLDATVTLDGVAEAINNRGEIVGWRTVGSHFRSVYWGGIFPLEGEYLFESNNHKALGINDDGYVVGINMLADGEPDEGWYWNTGESITDPIDVIGSSYFPIGGVNNNGLTAGQQIDGADYLKIGDSVSKHIRSLATDDAYSIALGLNDLDIMVGDSGQKGFIYDHAASEFAHDSLVFDINRFMTLGLHPDSITRLTDINNSNVFVGVGLVNGVEHGLVGEFVAVPEPGTLFLALLGLTIGISHKARSSKNSIR